MVPCPIPYLELVRGASGDRGGVIEVRTADRAGLLYALASFTE